ncbi:hypothetical protein CHUAL_013638 [Chamberlinius hualienensis]
MFKQDCRPRDYCHRWKVRTIGISIGSASNVANQVKSPLGRVFGYLFSFSLISAGVANLIDLPSIINRNKTN